MARIAVPRVATQVATHQVIEATLWRGQPRNESNDGQRALNLLGNALDVVDKTASGIGRWHEPQAIGQDSQ